MKTKQTTQSLAAAALVLATTLGTPAHGGGEGNGDGYSGPNLYGESIPAQTETYFTEEDIGAALKHCAPEFVRDLWFQVTGESTFPGDIETMSGINKDRSIHWAIRIRTEPDWFDIDNGADGRDFVSDIAFKFYHSIEWIDVALRIPDAGRTPVNPRGVLPQLSFREFLEERIYDDLGRHVETRRRIIGLKLSYPSRRIGLINAETGKPTKVRLNAIPFARCLESTLQLDSDATQQP